MSSFFKLFTFILWPVSFLWNQLYRFRRFGYNYGLFKRSEFELPIVSVGNLSFGGTGKTPCTLWLADYILERGFRPLILMRGYKGKSEKGGMAVTKNSLDSVDVDMLGDEGALLSNRLPQVPIVVGRGRSENLKFFYPKYQPDVVLLDDGHQHLKLSRDLNIVLFDALMPTEKYKTAPLGYLREGLGALQDADAILFSRADQVSTKKIEDLKNLFSEYISKDVVYGEFRYVPQGFYNREFEKVFDLESLQGKNVYAMSGIASPESFYNLLESLGLTISQKHTYPDHHKYIAEELTPILEAAKKNDTYVIATEKDMIKLRDLVESERILYLEIQMDFLSGQQAIEKLIDKVL